MGRRGALALLWRTVDVLVTNRRVRGDTHGADEFDAVEQWLKHQRDEREAKNNENKQQDRDSSVPIITVTTARKTRGNVPKKRRGVVHQHTSVEKSVLPPVPAHQNSTRSAKFRAPSAAPQHRAAATTVKPRASAGPPLLYRGGAGESSDRFMDRDFMQQMQRRLLEQHEETLRRRIRERQAEEAQRERQLVLAGLMPSPPSSVVSATASPKPALTPKRVLSRVSHTNGTRLMPRGSPRSHRNARRSNNVSPRPSKKGGFESPDPTDELDEAAESLPPPPKPPDPRPRLALLMQACRAVVGTHGGTELPPLPTRRLPESGEGEEISLLKIKYESPLISQLREVESVEELYRLAEMIVASTKHP